MESSDPWAGYYLLRFRRTLTLDKSRRLGDTQRAELWGRRVDALQQLVGIEATNRLYAARGQSYDAALVSID